MEIVLGALALVIGFIIAYDTEKKDRMPACSGYSDEYKS